MRGRKESLTAAEHALGERTEELEERADPAEEARASAELRHRERDRPERRRVGVPPQLALRAAAIGQDEARPRELGKDMRAVRDAEAAVAYAGPGSLGERSGEAVVVDRDDARAELGRELGRAVHLARPDAGGEA